MSTPDKCPFCGAERCAWPDTMRGFGEYQCGRYSDDVEETPDCLRRQRDQLRTQLNAATELLREIRDNEVNPRDEADKFMRDHKPSELSQLREKVAELEDACKPSKLNDSDMTDSDFCEWVWELVADWSTDASSDWAVGTIKEKVESIWYEANRALKLEQQLIEAQDQLARMRESTVPVEVHGFDDVEESGAYVMFGGINGHVLQGFYGSAAKVEREAAEWIKAQHKEDLQ